MKSDLSVSMGKLVEAAHLVMQVRVTGVTTWRFRLWVGTRLFHLASRLVGAGCEISLKP